MGEASGQRNDLDLDMAGEGTGFHCQLFQLRVVEEVYFAGFQDACHASCSCSQTTCVQQTQVDAAAGVAGCHADAPQHYGCPGPGFLLGFQDVQSPQCELG